MRPQAAAMKALLDQPGLQIMPGCGDGMGARLIEEAGFRLRLKHRCNASGDARHGPLDLSGNGRRGRERHFRRAQRMG
jgi:hypothetical protein